MKKAAVIGLALLVLGAVSAPAAPPDPELEARLKAEGKWEEFVIQYKSWGRKMGYPNPNPYRVDFSFYGKVAAGQVPPDTLKVVVIYAAPSDRPTSADGINVTQAQLQTILFGANPTGSMTDYYKQISFGQTIVLGTVYGPFTLPQTNAYYTAGAFGMGNYPNNAQKFVEDAVAAADPTVNFSQFDANGDGRVDGLFVIHSGPGGEQTGNPNDIWSHAWNFSTPLRDGKAMGNYAIQPEQQGTSPIQIGVFCHEAGHSLFGLPDLYDTDYSSSGLGYWCLMSGGNYLNGSRTPAHMSAWCKKEVGWLAPITVTANQAGVSLPTSQFNPAVYRLWKHGQGGLEYFLVENRSKRGFDAFLPGSGGILIWHIDEAVANNNSEPRYLVALEQADGFLQLENGVNWGDGGDPFPGSSNKRSFDQFTNPGSKSNGGQPTQVAVRGISNVDSVMSADFEIFYGQPYIVFSRPLMIFDALYKGAMPPAESVLISNDGGGTLNWRAGLNPPGSWLSVWPESGQAPSYVLARPATSALLPGLYTDTLVITADSALNAPQKITVSYSTYNLRGDLNRDGTFTPVDAVALMNCVFSDNAASSCELLFADSDCDGALGPTDAVLLLWLIFMGRALPCPN